MKEMETNNTERKVEAFRSLTFLKSMKPFTKLLTKRVGKKMLFSPLPFAHKTNYIDPFGKMVQEPVLGYYIFVKDTHQSIRLNFLVKNDYVVSVDYFDEISLKPKFTLELEGANLIQALDTIVDMIRGRIRKAESVESISNSLKEVRSNNSFEGWLNSDPSVMQMIRTDTVDDLYNRSYLPYTASNRLTPLVIGGFGYRLKQYLKANGIINRNIRVGTVRRGTVTRPVQTRVDLNAQTAIRDTVRSTDHIKKFKALEKYTRMIARKSPYLNSMIVFGQAGIGKTQTIKNILREENADFVFKSGGIAGKTGLLQLLWDYRDNKILVLDDNDGILADKTAVNFLKAALQDQDRVVSYSKARSRAARESVRRQEDLDLTAFEDDSGVDAEDIPIPDEFVFNSKMIFISNLMEFPLAIKSRSVRIKIDMTFEQTMDLIKENLNNVYKEYPEITLEMKQEVFEYVLSLSDTLDSIDFRQFKFAIIPYLAYKLEGLGTEEEWKDYARIQLTS